MTIPQWSTVSTAVNFLWFPYQISPWLTVFAPQSRSSVPLENVTLANKEIVPAWMPIAEVCGTMDILHSCLIMLTLCVYTYLHRRAY